MGYDELECRRFWVFDLKTAGCILDPDRRWDDSRGRQEMDVLFMDTLCVLQALALRFVRCCRIQTWLPSQVPTFRFSTSSNKSDVQQEQDLRSVWLILCKSWGARHAFHDIQLSLRKFHNYEEIIGGYDTNRPNAGYVCTLCNMIFGRTRWRSWHYDRYYLRLVRGKWHRWWVYRLGDWRVAFQSVWKRKKQHQCFYWAWAPTIQVTFGDGYRGGKSMCQGWTSGRHGSSWADNALHYPDIGKNAERKLTVVRGCDFSFSFNFKITRGEVATSGFVWTQEYSMN